MMVKNTIKNDSETERKKIEHVASSKLARWICFIYLFRTY